MDQSRQPGEPRGPVMDVRPPGASPAPPSGKPVITNYQQPVSDPMMTGRPSPLDASSNEQAATPLQSSQVPQATSQIPQTTGFQTANPPAVQAEAEPLAQQTSSLQNQPAGQAGSVESLHQLAHPEAFAGQFKKKKRGKKILIVLLILLLVGGGAAAAWLLLGKKNNDSSAANTAPAVTPAPAKEEPKSDKLYTSKLAGFEINNLYDWKVTETDTTQSKYADIAADTGSTYATVEFAINDKQKITFEANPGGRGGDCGPEENDEPFKPGNYCGSYRATQADKLPESSYSKAKDQKWLAGAYVVRYQIMLPTEDDKQYTLVGIATTKKDNSDQEEKIELNKATMGAVWPQTTLSKGMNDGYIDIKISDNNGKLTQLSDQDLDRVTEFLKTFKLI